MSNPDHWLAQHIAKTDEHVRLFRIVAVALNAILASHAMFDARITSKEIEFHDASKYGPDEAQHYARRFYGPNDDPEGWERALQHHYANNAHHWIHWVRDGVPQPMPPHETAAMVADWFASGRQHAGKWDMWRWLCDNVGGTQPKVLLHTDTYLLVNRILGRCGYVTNMDNAGMYGMIETSFDTLLSFMEPTP